MVKRKDKLMYYDIISFITMNLTRNSNKKDICQALNTSNLYVKLYA